ncbi:MAG: hypothetical protein D3910_20495 [Candidatus Electrothrix sp. ATG2]|nr:hypothetical protein [Candidatus Electrothrix sp. ATG2]
MAGEEISWGQRIMEIETIEIMKQINVQGENNLHNLFGYFADHAFIGAIFMFGFVLPVLANRNLFIRQLCDFIGLPVASIGLAIGFLMISLVHDWTLYLIFDKVTSLRMAELREFLTSIALLLLMIESWLFIEAKSPDGITHGKY